MVPTAVLPDIQLPPGVASLSNMLLPAHTPPAPEMGMGNAVTVTCLVILHPVVSV
jgi:hypothetical protein